VAELTKGRSSSLCPPPGGGPPPPAPANGREGHAHDASGSVKSAFADGRLCVDRAAEPSQPSPLTEAVLPRTLPLHVCGTATGTAMVA